MSISDQIKWRDKSNGFYLTHFVYTGCSLNIVFFLKILWFFWTLPVLLQRCWYSTCLVCVHTLTPKENRERQKSGIFKNLRKNTILNEQPVEPLTTKLPIVGLNFWRFSNKGTALKYYYSIFTEVSNSFKALLISWKKLQNKNVVANNKGGV